MSQKIIRIHNRDFTSKGPQIQAPWSRREIGDTKGGRVKVSHKDASFCSELKTEKGCIFLGR